MPGLAHGARGAPPVPPRRWERRERRDFAPGAAVPSRGGAQWPRAPEIARYKWRRPAGPARQAQVWRWRSAGAAAPGPAATAHPSPLLRLSRLTHAPSGRLGAVPTRGRSPGAGCGTLGALGAWLCHFVLPQGLADSSCRSSFIPAFKACASPPSTAAEGSRCRAVVKNPNLSWQPCHVCALKTASV